MQRVEFIDPLEPNEPFIPPDTIDPAEAITDPEEILGMIRRAVTISWQDQAFTYDELAQRLTKNSAVLPEAATAREEFFEDAMQDIWHQQKELARIAMQPIPTRLRYTDPNTKTVYHGIVTPVTKKAPELTPVVIAPEPEQHKETVTVLSERRPALTAPEVARILLEKFTERAVYDTILDVKKLTESLLAERPATAAETIKITLREMSDNGYITWRNTGTKKHPRMRIVMSQDVKQDVLSHMVEDDFDEALQDIFGYIDADHDIDTADDTALAN